MLAVDFFCAGGNSGGAASDGLEGEPMEDVFHPQAQPSQHHHQRIRTQRMHLGCYAYNQQW